ncbi:hydrolase domain protein [Vibrio paracholerae 87395]|nr:hydrolase domain protein [Vibrio paracholerae 87395]
MFFIIFWSVAICSGCGYYGLFGIDCQVLVNCHFMRIIFLLLRSIINWIVFLSYLWFFSFKNGGNFSFLFSGGYFQFFDFFVVVFIVFLFVFSVFVLVIFPFVLFCFDLVLFVLF